MIAPQEADDILERFRSRLLSIQLHTGAGKALERRKQRIHFRPPMNGVMRSNPVLWPSVEGHEVFTAFSLWNTSTYIGAGELQPVEVDRGDDIEVVVEWRIPNVSAAPPS